MSTILLICDDETFRHSLRQTMGGDAVAVLGVPNTRALLSQPGARQVSGYDLIVAEVLSTDHDGLSRLVLFRNLHPNTPFIAVTREDEGTGLAYGGAAARALRAWHVPITSQSFDRLTETASHALRGDAPPLSMAQSRR